VKYQPISIARQHASHVERDIVLPIPSVCRPSVCPMPVL